MHLEVAISTQGFQLKPNCNRKRDATRMSFAFSILWKIPLVSILSTFYEQFFRTKVLLCTALLVCVLYFFWRKEMGKKVLVKCWWNFKILGHIKAFAILATFQTEFIFEKIEFIFRCKYQLWNILFYLFKSFLLKDQQSARFKEVSVTG